MAFEIKVKKPKKGELERLGVFGWPIWEKEVSEFEWFYGSGETFYVLEGAVRVEPEDGEPAEFGAGDLVRMPKGMACKWKVSSPIRKHYRFD